MRGLIVRSFVSCAVLAVVAAPGVAQATCSWLAVDGATATALGVLWSHGYDDDPPGRAGLARVLAECRLERGRAAVPGLKASGMLVGGDFALVFGVVGAGDVDAATRFVGALLDDAAPRPDDELALCIARAALAADDSEHVYPGSVFEAAARQRLGRGSVVARAPDGDAAQIAALTPGDVRRHLRAAVPMRAAGLGVVPAALCDAMEGLAWPAVDVPVRGDTTCPAGARPDGTQSAEHNRLDGPFVAAAFPAPGPEQRAALAVGLEVARARAQRRFRSHGSEALARAPFVRWSWLMADPIVLFCRRGSDPVKLRPGERAEADAGQEASATARQLAAFLQDLRATPPSAAELAAATRALSAELSLPGPGERPPWAAEPALLPGRSIVLLLAAHHGIELSALGGVTAEGAHAALRHCLEPERASWHALLPEPRSDRGFRRR